MTEELTHIRRTPLPWRQDEGLTECGRDAAGYPTWTRDEAVAQRARLGQSRFAMVICMTCMDRARVRYYVEQDRGLLPVLEREIVRCTTKRGTDEADRLTAELEAMVALVEAHRDEFDGYLADRAGTTSLAERRKQRG